MSVQVKGILTGETEEALSILVDGKLVWIPLSQVKSIKRPVVGPATVTLSRWFAEKKGLVEKE
jgi:hypothetical protein